MVLKQDLADYGAAQGGRVLLFGSAALGSMRQDSDVDLLVDLPTKPLDDACWQLRPTPDIRPRSRCGRRLVDHVAGDGVSLP